MEIKSKEMWVPVPNSVYSISSFGNLKNNKRNRDKKASVDKDGYLYFCLVFSGNTKRKISSHRLVAEYFLKDFCKEKQVNHIDFNRRNNRVENLEMKTLQENIKHSANAGRYIKNGQANNNCKFDDIKILTIKTCAGFFTDKFIADSIGLNRKYVNDVKLGKIRAS